MILDYTIKTSKIDNGKSHWNSTLCEIYKGEEKIGEYKRTYYAYSEKTFYPFTFNGNDYALYSENYTQIQLMSLPDCKEIILKEDCKKQMANFCPTELYVPICAKIKYEDGRIIQYWINNLDDKEDGEEYEYLHIASALGCVWGDDSSWKLMLIDLRKIEEGEIWFIDNKLEKKWLYEDFPDSIRLKDIEWYFDDEFSYMPSGYKQLIQKYVYFDN